MAGRRHGQVGRYPPAIRRLPSPGHRKRGAKNDTVHGALGAFELDPYTRCGVSLTVHRPVIHLIRNMFYRYTTLVATVLLLSYTGGNDAVAQCSTSNATSCQCRTSGQSNCDLLPDITISWKALRDYAGGPNEYPQNDPSNPGRLRVTGSGERSSA